MHAHVATPNPGTKLSCSNNNADNCTSNARHRQCQIGGQMTENSEHWIERIGSTEFRCVHKLSAWQRYKMNNNRHPIKTVDISSQQHQQACPIAPSSTMPNGRLRPVFHYMAGITNRRPCFPSCCLFQAMICRAVCTSKSYIIRVWWWQNMSVNHKYKHS